MLTLPAATPVMTPVPDAVAIAVLLLLHVPPATVLESVVVNPTQTLLVPVMDAGIGLTVTLVTEVQPAGNVYVMVAIPALMPEITPEPTPAVAIAVLLLDHAPPLVASARMVVAPTQTVAVPVIAAGIGLTVKG